MKTKKVDKQYFFIVLKFWFLAAKITIYFAEIY
jgi:hypothetical protein